MMDNGKFLHCNQPGSFPMATIGNIADMFNLNRAKDTEVNGIPSTTTASTGLFSPDAVCPGLLFPPTCTIQPDLTATTRLSHRQDNQNAVVMTREEALVTLSEKTSYPILQENGQRRYGPPPDWKGPQPPRGCEVFIGKIPRDCFEDELVPIFEMVGRIYMFRLMMDFSGCNRGYGFCIYTNREDTRRAVAELDSYEIRRGKMLGVCFSVDNCRLFVGGIPKNKTKEEVMTEMLKVTEGVKDVIVYPSVADKTKNRGFAFVEYENHKAAAMARRKLIPGRIHLWGHQIAVDWAEPEREVDEDIMSKVRILYVRNLMLHTTEEALRDHFNRAIGNCDAVERVKKIRDYAFVHFRDRLQASVALRQLDGTLFEGSLIEVTWAKPVDKNEGIRVNRLINNSLTTPVFNMPNFCFPPSRNLHDCDLMNSLTSKFEPRETSPHYCFQTGGYSTLSTTDELMSTSQMNLAKIPSGLRQMSLLGNEHQSTNQLQQTCLTNPTTLNSNALSAFTARIPLYQPKATTFCEMQKPDSMNGSIPHGLVVSESAQLGLFPFNNKVNYTTSGCSNTSSGCRPNRQNDAEAPPLSSMCPPSGYGKSCEVMEDPMDNMKDVFRSNDAAKLLTDVCMKHGLELPKIITHVHEGNVSQTEKRYPTFNVQLYLPTVQRYFNSSSPLPSVEEATQSAALVTLQWLNTNLPLLRSSLDNSQKPFVIPELFAPKRHDNSLLPCQNYVNYPTSTNDQMHYTTNPACADDKSIQPFFGRQSDGSTQVTLENSKIYPQSVNNKHNLNRNEIQEPSLLKLIKPVKADFLNPCTEIILSNIVVHNTTMKNDNRSMYFENVTNDDNLVARNQPSHYLLPVTINSMESDLSRLKLENNFITSVERLCQPDSRANVPKSPDSLHYKLMYVNQEKEVPPTEIHFQPVDHRSTEVNPPAVSSQATVKNEYSDKSVNQTSGGLTHNELSNLPLGAISYMPSFTQPHALKSTNSHVHWSGGTNPISSPVGLVGNGDSSMLDHKLQVNYGEKVSQTQRNETQSVSTLHSQHNSMALTDCSDSLTSQFSSIEDKSLQLGMVAKTSTDHREYSQCFPHSPTSNTVFHTRTI